MRARVEAAAAAVAAAVDDDHGISLYLLSQQYSAQSAGVKVKNVFHGSMFAQYLQCQWHTAVRLCRLDHTLCCAGILYHDMYASDLVGTHVEMRSLEVCHMLFQILQDGQQLSRSLHTSSVVVWPASVPTDHCIWAQAQC